MDSPSDYSIGERVLTGTLWVGSWRWTARLIGLVTTVILARLLLPEDFGIVATAGLVIAFFDVLLELGTDQYLIRLPRPTRDDYDTAWTLRLGVVIIASLLTFLSAVPMAVLFGDDRLIAVIRVLAVVNVMRGFANIGLTMYRRDLRYDKIAFVGLAQRLIGAIVTVALAIALESYWAMVLGGMAACVTELWMSYLIHPYRPRFALANFGAQWGFSKWIVVRNVAVYLQGQGDQFVVAKFFGIEQIGFYSMAMRIAAAPTSQLTSPMRNPVYSGMARKQDDPALFNRSMLQVMGATCAIVLPGATLCATLSEALVLVVFGAKWQPAAPLVLPLVYGFVFIVLTQPAISALTVAGSVRLLAVLHWAGALAVIGVMLIAGYFWDLEQLAFARGGVALVFFVAYCAAIAVTLAIPWRDVLASIYRPGVASLVMGLLTASIAATPHGPWLKLALAVLGGGATYVAALYALWRIAGSPASGEALLVRKTAAVLARAVRRLRA